MPIRIPDPISGTVELVQSALAPLMALREFQEAAGLNGPLGALGLSMAAPHDVFTVTVDDVLNGDLEGARATAHRIVAMAGDTVIGIIDLTLDSSGQPAALRNVSKGQAVETLARVVSSLDSLPEVARTNFELRGLEINELNLSAVWLRSESGQEDVVVPVRAFEPLTPGQAMELPTFLEEVRRQGQELLATARGLEV